MSINEYRNHVRLFDVQEVGTLLCEDQVTLDIVTGHNGY